MSTKLGSDPDQLEDLAAFLRAKSDEVSQQTETATAVLRSLAWYGTDADYFRRGWYGHARNLGHVASQLTTAAIRLEREAAEQRQTSADVVGTQTEAAPELACQMPESLRQAHEETRRNQQLMSEAEEASADGSAAFIAYWDNLTDEERSLLMSIAPGLVLRNADALAGADHPLSKEDEALALQAWIDDSDFDRYESSVAFTMSADAQFKVISLGGEGEVEIVEQTGGGYVVNLALEGYGEYMEMGGGAGVGLSYEFESREEAEAFVDGIRDKATPGWKDVLAVGGPLWLPGGAVTASTAARLFDYLGKHDNHRTSTKLEVEGRVSVEKPSGGAIELEAGAGIGISHDTVTGETTVYIEGRGSAAADLGLPAGFEGSANAAAEARLDVVIDPLTGEMKELRVNASVAAEADVDLQDFASKFRLPPDAVAMAGGGIQIDGEFSLDPHDPHVQAHLDDLLSGDLSSIGDLIGDVAGVVHVSSVSTAEITDINLGLADLDVDVAHRSTTKQFNIIPGYGVVES